MPHTVRRRDGQGHAKPAPRLAPRSSSAIAPTCRDAAVARSGPAGRHPRTAPAPASQSREHALGVLRSATVRPDAAERSVSSPGTRGSASAATAAVEHAVQHVVEAGSVVRRRPPRAAAPASRPAAARPGRGAPPADRARAAASGCRSPAGPPPGSAGRRPARRGAARHPPGRPASSAGRAAGRPRSARGRAAPARPGSCRAARRRPRPARTAASFQASWCTSRSPSPIPWPDERRAEVGGVAGQEHPAGPPAVGHLRPERVLDRPDDLDRRPGRPARAAPPAAPAR